MSQSASSQEFFFLFCQFEINKRERMVWNDTVNHYADEAVNQKRIKILALL